MTKFVADHMLGTLAKWLRLFGYDTVYPKVEGKTPGDTDIIELASAEGRVLLTRDKGIPARKASRSVRVVLIKGDDVQEQIMEVFSTLDIRPREEEVLTRCSACNSEIRDVSREEATGHVPDGVLERQHQFWKCGGCGRYYWEGTHWEKIMAIVEKVITSPRPVNVDHPACDNN